MNGNNIKVPGKLKSENIIIDFDTGKITLSDFIMRYTSGNIPLMFSCKSEIYHKNGIVHRDSNLPSVIIRYSKIIKLELYSVDGILHRENGAAYIKKDKELYYYNGNKIKNLDKLRDERYDKRNSELF